MINLIFFFVDLLLLALTPQSFVRLLLLFFPLVCLDFFCALTHWSGISLLLRSELQQFRRGPACNKPIARVLESVGSLFGLRLVESHLTELLSDGYFHASQAAMATKQVADSLTNCGGACYESTHFMSYFLQMTFLLDTVRADAVPLVDAFNLRFVYCGFDLLAGKTREKGG